MFKFLVSIFIAFGFFSGALLAESDYGRVAKVDVVVKRVSPSETIDPSTVRAKMKTKEGGIFSQTDFDNDLKALSQEYDRVEPEIDYQNNQVFITLNIWAKPTIRAIIWDGNEKVKADKLQSELDIKPGSVFDRFQFNEAFHKVKAYYVKKGYFEAHLDYVVIPLHETNEVDVEITINEGRAGRIKKICFDGFTKKEINNLSELILTKQYSIFTSWFDDTGTFQPEILEHDKLSVAHFLQNEGYADARVDITITETDRDDRINVLITADRGEMYYFGDLTFEGNTIFTEEQVQRQFRIGGGCPFSPDLLRDTVQQIALLYGAHGYIESNVNFQPSLREDAPIYDVHFTIHEGEQFRIGLIKIFGNTHTQTRVILHECLLVPGQVFDSRKLLSTEQRLQNIQYFKNVNVYPVRSSEEKLLGSNYRDVHIEIEEENTGNLSAFFGFSTIDAIFGGLEVMERNFNYRGIPGLFRGDYMALRGGGEYLHLKAMLGTKNSDYSLRWVKPYFYDSNWIVGFDLEQTSNRMVSKDYNIETWGFRPHATYPINAYLSMSSYYRLRWTDTVLHNNKLKGKEVPQAQSGGWLSGVGLSFLYSRLDSVHQPHDGFKSDLSLEGVGLGSTYHFLTGSYLNSLYVPMSSRGTLKFRADLKLIKVFHDSKRQPYNGTTLSREDSLPLSEKFFLGGETTVRGYRGFSIGPEFPGSEDPIGGVTSLLLSEEYMHKLFSRIDGFVFFDAGCVSNQEFTFPTLRASVGAGLRVQLFNQIPITFGMGYPINPQRQSDVQRFFVSLGGRF